MIRAGYPVPVCRVCDRRRIDGQWLVTDVAYEREVDGMCSMCLIALEANRRLARKLADENARRDRRRGRTYGPPKPGEDPFRNFR